MKLYTYLNYGGNCEQAFRFYEQHLGGKISMMLTHGQQPNGNDVPPNQKNTILHARIGIGETELLGADVPPERFQPCAAPIYPSFSTAARKRSESMRCSPRTARSSCPSRRPSLPSAMPCSGTSSAPCGCSSTTVPGHSRRPTHTCDNLLSVRAILLLIPIAL